MKVLHVLILAMFVGMLAVPVLAQPDPFAGGADPTSQPAPTTEDSTSDRVARLTPLAEDVGLKQAAAVEAMQHVDVQQAVKVSKALEEALNKGDRSAGVNLAGAAAQEWKNTAESLAAARTSIDEAVSAAQSAIEAAQREGADVQVQRQAAARALATTIESRKQNFANKLIESISANDSRATARFRRLLSDTLSLEKTVKRLYNPERNAAMRMAFEAVADQQSSIELSLLHARGRMEEIELKARDRASLMTQVKTILEMSDINQKALAAVKKLSTPELDDFNIGTILGVTETPTSELSSASDQEVESYLRTISRR